MHSDTSSRILTIIREKGSATPHELSNVLGISKQAIHRQLLKLQEKNKIQKRGTPPLVLYVPQEETIKKGQEAWLPSEADIALLEHDFYLITPEGIPLEGATAFAHWCHRRALPFAKTLLEYKAIQKKYDRFKKQGLINGMQKMKKTFESVHLDALYYLDFYQIDRFGRTKLGTLMLYAKQNQDTKLMKNIANMIREPIQKLIQQKKFDAVCYIPPTVKRSVQFMSELRKNLAISLPNITLKKIRTKITVPQKTLNKLEDRIINARTTLYSPQSQATFQHILLIDDAIGSGATMNEAARILKAKKYCSKITGLGITGSPSGFEVISEV